MEAIIYEKQVSATFCSKWYSHPFLKIILIAMCPIKLFLLLLLNKKVDTEIGLQLIQNLYSQHSKTAFLLTNTSFYDTQRDQGSVLVALPYQKQTESDTVSQI